MSQLVHGHADPRLEGVRAMLDQNLESGAEVGATLTVDLDGHRVVDLWGGHTDAARTRPWTEDTIVNVWSSTKTVTNLAALILVERGLLDVGEPVATYWPEFAANGKEGIEVRHIMSHTSGVSGWEQPFEIVDMFDREAATARLAEQSPWWKPGTASGYHGANLGHLVGEVVRRVSGLTLTEFVRTEIAEPLGADFQIGVRPEDDSRVADIVPYEKRSFDLSAMSPGSPAYKTFFGPVSDPAAANWPQWRRAEIGATNGHGNARSLARVMSVISRGGEVGGVRLLGPSTIDLIFDEQVRGIDLVLGVPLRWGIGYALPEPATVPAIPDDGRICFWGGWGGSMIVMHPDRGLTISYVMNKMASGVIGSELSNAYLAAIYEGLE
ncbi:serine hydrolase domain-containing protein [Gordonia sp. NPDC003376]